MVWVSCLSLYPLAIRVKWASVLSSFNLSLNSCFQGLFIKCLFSLESSCRLFQKPPSFPDMMPGWPHILKGKNGFLGHSPQVMPTACLVAGSMAVLGAVVTHGLASPSQPGQSLVLLCSNQGHPPLLGLRSPRPWAHAPSSFSTLALLCGHLSLSWGLTVALNSAYVTHSNWGQLWKWNFMVSCCHGHDVATPRSVGRGRGRGMIVVRPSLSRVLNREQR